MMTDGRAFVFTSQGRSMAPRRILASVFGLTLVAAVGGCADRHYPIGEIIVGGGSQGGNGGTTIRGDGGAPAGGASGIAGASGFGGVDGLGGALGGGGGLAPPSPPIACPIPGAPMPERPLAISLELLADRLSRYLQGHRADATFVQLVKDVAPQTNRDVQAFVRQILSGGSPYLVSELVLGWLKLDVNSPDITPAVRSQYTATTWHSIGQEPHVFLGHLLWDSSSDHRLTTLLTAPHSLIDDQLAGIYGVPVPPQPGFRVANLGPRRSGILTVPATLALHPRATGRGSWVSDVFLCRGVDVLPATPNFPELPFDGMTYRQSLEQATSACGGACHALPDDLGFTLEHFDALGRWRDTDNGLPVDSSVSLAIEAGRPPVEVDGPSAMGHALATSCSVQQCVAQKFLELAVGGKLRVSEQASLDEVTRAFVASGLDLRELLVFTVGSEAFLNP